MHNCISVKFHKMSRNMDSLSTFLNSIKFKDTTMLFFSKECYEFIKSNSSILGKTLYPFNSRNFMQYNASENIRDYFSLVPLYSGEWIYLQELSSPNISFSYICGLPKQIKFVYLEEEFKQKYIKVKVIDTDIYQCPVNCVIEDFKKFYNSFLILSEEGFDKLKNTTNLVSYYEGTYNISWASDNDYTGGIVRLKTLNNKKHYLIEGMVFPFFNKTFSINEFPDAIYFIN